MSNNNQGLKPKRFLFMLEAVGLTMVEFRQLTGVHQTTTSRWLHDVHPIPRWVELLLTVLILLPNRTRREIFQQLNVKE